MSRTRTRRGSVIVKALAWPLVVMGIAWAGLALWIDGPSTPWLAAILSITFVAGCMTVLILFRPFSRALLLVDRSG